MKLFIIVNPISGRGNGEKSIPKITAFFQKENIEYVLMRTLNPGHALELAGEGVKLGYDVIVSVGGDGTANEVLNGMIQANKAIGGSACMAVIPVGRGNDFAYGMGVPLSLEEACQCVLTGHHQIVDIGRVYGDNFPDGRYFGNGVGVGFDAVVGFESLKLKYLTGFPSYIVAALKTTLLYFKAPKLHLKTSSGEITGKYLMVSIMNGKRMGGGFYMAPLSSPTDGVFDLCIVNEVRRRELLPLVSKFTKGSQNGDPAVTFLQASSIEVQAIEGSIPAHADGETVCTNGHSIRIEMLPKQLAIITRPV